ncbi:UPF0716 protein FxsA [Sinobacterium caligoides]|uniref:UPF0716 protein FxsA n=1 Tax=Sinobacterium caligoides TaxID=933926 RepID=A0A3N2DN91_9GAMM|nr:FxsA family protein [Sinobacterium caligoides]ROS01277.1 UPF0716 protein FxsA [Sinobacterium caligoides]
MRFLFMMFIVVPIVEMYLLFQVSGVIGALPTIGLVLLTAVIGSWLLRKEGLSTLFRANQKMQTGQIPAKEMAEGIAIAVGGALLLTPGFVTDTIGFCCLIPGIRRPLISLIAKRLVAAGGKVHVSSMHVGGEANPFGTPGGDRNRAGHRGVDDKDVIEGEYKRED